MVSKRLIYLFFIYFLLPGYSALAQKTTMPVVSGDFKNITAEQFVLQLEKQTSLNL